MVINLLADANITGHIDHMVRRWRAGEWSGFWTFLQLQLLTFQEVGLDPADSDAVVWQRCQERQLYLLTNNRSDKGPDSLETTIRSHNTPQSLPVFTIGDADRILQERDYCDSVIVGLLDYLLEPDNIRGTGRLFLPGSVM